jgi:hypothetical protein
MTAEPSGFVTDFLGSVIQLFLLKKNTVLSGRVVKTFHVAWKRNHKWQQRR